jgi:phage shock protein PspC (stress-responsive transcriptional regulator)
MKKVININFQGRVIPIEEAAYDTLKQYVESLRSFFVDEEGRDEIINDIEGRIAELFGEVLKKGSTCITDADVEAIIASMGRPEDFDDDEAKVKSQLGGQQKSQQGSSSSSSSSNFSSRGFTATTAGGRFYRDENQKVIAGVCSGIANYFGIDPLVVRILFVIFAFGVGFGFVVYLVLWVAVPSTASKVIGSVKKRLFRDPDNKLIAGVCSGLSNYFGVNIWIPRVLFLIPFISFASRWSRWGAIDFPNFLSLSFSPGALLIYIILWLVLPEALTTSEKLEMKGERVDLNSIKSTIQNDMEGFKDRAEKFGKEVGEKAQQFGKEFGERSKTVGSEMGHAARRGGTGIGHVIGLLIKGFVYFIVGLILFWVLVGLFAAGVALSSLFPTIKDFVLADGWQTLFAWGILILGIWVPVIGIITWIIRRLAKMRSNSRTIRFTFVALWLLGLFCFVGLLASIKDGFRYRTNNVIEQQVSLAKPGIGKLDIRVAKQSWYHMHDNFLHFEPFASFDEDSVYVNNLRLRFVKSTTDSFQVTIAKMANGRTTAEANELANKIVYTIAQQDSSLVLDRGIKIDRTNKFRNQAVYVTVAVPVGKRIFVEENLWWNNFDTHFGWDDEWRYQNDFYDQGQRAESNVEYVMTIEGKLKRVHPKMEDHNDDDSASGDNSSNVTPNNGNTTDSSTYRYKQNDGKPKAPIKPAAPKKDTIGIKQAQTNAGEKVITALPTMFIERFTI